MALNIIEKLGDESAKGLVQFIISCFKKLGKFAFDEVKIHEATDKYAENYLRRFCTIKILGMPDPVSLRGLYTDVQIVYSQNKYKGNDISELDEAFREARIHGKQMPRMSGIEIANEKDKLNVLGQPGSGKSTLLRKIGLECLTYYDFPAKQTYRYKCIPVLIELKRFRLEPIDIFGLIQKEFDIAGFPESSPFTERMLKDGKLLILLDGIDEVPLSKIDEVLLNIKDFTDKYNKNRFITSCRTAFYRNYLNGFTDVEISSFSDNQVNQFAQNWFSLENDSNAITARFFLEQLYKEGNEPTLELARTPLLLTFLCMTFDESQRLPSNRASLYRQALAILMHKWAAEKRIHQEDIYQNLNIDLETEMLAHMAAYFYVKDKLFFYDSEVKDHIKSFLAKKLNTDNLNIDRILNAIEVQQGILVERSLNIYSFSHLTIQEYLTAYYYNSPKRVLELIRQFIFDKRWREVFVLLAGIGDPNDTLLLMTEEVKKYAADNKLISTAKNWVRSLILINDSPEISAAKRVFLVSLLLRYKRYDSEPYNSYERLEMYTDKLMERLSQAFYDFTAFDLKQHMSPKQGTNILKQITPWLIPNKIDATSAIVKIKTIKPDRPLSKMVHGSRHAYRQQIVQEIYTSLNIPVDIVNLRRNLYEPFLKYFDACVLIIDCGRSSHVTEHTTWKRICENIL